MDLSKADWTMIGIGAGGLLAGILGTKLLSSCTSKPIDTGISRLYRINKLRKSEIAFYIKASEDGFFLDYDAPYGIRNAEGELLSEESESIDEEVDGIKFDNIEDAANHADEIMEARGYTATDGWLDSLEDDLKE